MRCLFLLPVLLMGMSIWSQVDPQVTNSAMVIVRIQGLDAALWTKVSARVSKEPQMNIEYSCLLTGVVILHLRNLSVGEKADVMAVVKRVLEEGGVTRSIKFLDVQVYPVDDDQCRLPGDGSRRAPSARGMWRRELLVPTS